RCNRGHAAITNTTRASASRGGMGGAKPYQKSASSGIMATATTAPALKPRQSSQPPHDTTSITTRKAPSCAANRCLKVLRAEVVRQRPGELVRRDGGAVDPLDVQRRPLASPRLFALLCGHFVPRFRCSPVPGARGGSR